MNKKIPAPPEGYEICDKNDQRLDDLPSSPLIISNKNPAYWEKTFYKVGESIHTQYRDDYSFALQIMKKN